MNEHINKSPILTTFALNRAPLNAQVSVWCDMWVVARDIAFPKGKDYISIHHDEEVAELIRLKQVLNPVRTKVVKMRFVWLDGHWWRTYAHPETNIEPLPASYDLSTDVCVVYEPMSLWSRIKFLFTGHPQYRATVTQPGYGRG